MVVSVQGLLSFGAGAVAHIVAHDVAQMRGGHGRWLGWEQTRYLLCVVPDHSASTGLT